MTGEDVDKVFGELITCKAHASTTKPQDTTSTSRKRRRKPRKKHKVTSSPLSITAYKTNSEDKSSSTGVGTVTGTEASAQFSTVPRTNFLVSYQDSSSSSGESDTGVRPGHPEAIGHLPIPAAIHDLYEDDNEPVPTLPGKQAAETDKEKMHTFDSGEEDSLGFFDSCSDPDDNDNVSNNGSALTRLSLMAPLGDMVPEVTKQWSEKKSQWIFGPSQLCSYTCWKCSNVGHLAQDCTVAVGGSRCVAGPAMASGSSVVRIPRSVQDLFATCRQIKGKKGQRCAHCGMPSNLVACLDCG